MKDELVALLKISICMPVIFVAAIGAAALVIRGFGIPGDSFLAIAVGWFVVMPVGLSLTPLMLWWVKR